MQPKPMAKKASNLSTSRKVNGTESDSEIPKGLLVMKELIQFIAHELVDNPEKVTVNEVIGNSTAVLELNVAKEDLGKVIGKHGRTAQAMRTLLNAASGKAKKRMILEIIE